MYDHEHHSSHSFSEFERKFLSSQEDQTEDWWVLYAHTIG